MVLNTWPTTRTSNRDFVLVFFYDHILNLTIRLRRQIYFVSPTHVACSNMDSNLKPSSGDPRQWVGPWCLHPQSVLPDSKRSHYW